MKTSQMTANEDALQEQTATAAYNKKVDLIRTPILRSIFSKTIIDTAKRFTLMKTTFQDEQVGWFSTDSEN